MVKVVIKSLRKKESLLVPPLTRRFEAKKRVFVLSLVSVGLKPASLTLEKALGVVTLPMKSAEGVPT